MTRIRVLACVGLATLSFFVAYQGNANADTATASTSVGQERRRSYLARRLLLGERSVSAGLGGDAVEYTSYGKKAASKRRKKRAEFFKKQRDAQEEAPQEGQPAQSEVDAARPSETNSVQGEEARQSQGASGGSETSASSGQSSREKRQQKLLEDKQEEGRKQMSKRDAKAEESVGPNTSEGQAAGGEGQLGLPSDADAEDPIARRRTNGARNQEMEKEVRTGDTEEMREYLEREDLKLQALGMPARARRKQLKRKKERYDSRRGAKQEVVLKRPAFTKSIERVKLEQLVKGTKADATSNGKWEHHDISQQVEESKAGADKLANELANRMRIAKNLINFRQVVPGASLLGVGYDLLTGEFTYPTLRASEASNEPSGSSDSDADLMAKYRVPRAITAARPDPRAREGKKSIDVFLVAHDMVKAQAERRGLDGSRGAFAESPSADEMIQIEARRNAYAEISQTFPAITLHWRDKASWDPRLQRHEVEEELRKRGGQPSPNFRLREYDENVVVDTAREHFAWEGTGMADRPWTFLAAQFGADLQDLPECIFCVDHVKNDPDVKLGGDSGGGNAEDIFWKFPYHAATADKRVSAKLKHQYGRVHNSDWACLPEIRARPDLNLPPLCSYIHMRKLNAFARKYGTHYVDQTTFGGKLKRKLEINLNLKGKDGMNNPENIGQIITQFVSDLVAESAGAPVDGKEGRPGGAAFDAHQSTLVDMGIIADNVEVHGGNLAAISRWPHGRPMAADDAKTTAWLKTVSEVPSVISFQVRPLWELADHPDAVRAYLSGYNPNVMSSLNDPGAMRDPHNFLPDEYVSSTDCDIAAPLVEGGNEEDDDNGPPATAVESMDASPRFAAVKDDGDKPSDNDLLGAEVLNKQPCKSSLVWRNFLARGLGYPNGTLPTRALAKRMTLKNYLEWIKIKAESVRKLKARLVEAKLAVEKADAMMTKYQSLFSGMVTNMMGAQLAPLTRGAKSVSDFVIRVLEDMNADPTGERMETVISWVVLYNKHLVNYRKSCAKACATERSLEERRVQMGRSSDEYLPSYYQTNDVLSAMGRNFSLDDPASGYALAAMVMEERQCLKTCQSELTSHMPHQVYPMRGLDDFMASNYFAAMLEDMCRLCNKMVVHELRDNNKPNSGPEPVGFLEQAAHERSPNSGESSSEGTAANTMKAEAEALSGKGQRFSEVLCQMRSKNKFTKKYCNAVAEYMRETLGDLLGQSSPGGGTELKDMIYDLFKQSFFFTRFGPKGQGINPETNRTYTKVQLARGVCDRIAACPKSMIIDIPKSGHHQNPDSWVPVDNEVKEEVEATGYASKLGLLHDADADESIGAMEGVAGPLPAGAKPKNDALAESEDVSEELKKMRKECPDIESWGAELIYFRQRQDRNMRRKKCYACFVHQYQYHQAAAHIPNILTGPAASKAQETHSDIDVSPQGGYHKLQYADAMQTALAHYFNNSHACPIGLYPKDPSGYLTKLSTFRKEFGGPNANKGGKVPMNGSHVFYDLNKDVCTTVKDKYVHGLREPVVTQDECMAILALVDRRLRERVAELVKAVGGELRETEPLPMVFRRFYELRFQLLNYLGDDVTAASGADSKRLRKYGAAGRSLCTDINLCTTEDERAIGLYWQKYALFRDNLGDTVEFPHVIENLDEHEAANVLRQGGILSNPPGWGKKIVGTPPPPPQSKTVPKSEDSAGDSISIAGLGPAEQPSGSAQIYNINQVQPNHGTSEAVATELSAPGVTGEHQKKIKSRRPAPRIADARFKELRVQAPRGSRTAGEAADIIAWASPPPPSPPEDRGMNR